MPDPTLRPADRRVKPLPVATRFLSGRIQASGENSRT